VDDGSGRARARARRSQAAAVVAITAANTSSWADVGWLLLIRGQAAARAAANDAGREPDHGDGGEPQ